MWNRSAVVVMIFGALTVSACAVGDQSSGPRVDELPTLLGACAEDAPDCQDTLVDDDLVEGGNDPLAPSTDADGSVPSGMVIDPLSVTEALAYQGSERIAVEGFIVRAGDTGQLCESLAESYPPQCGGASMTITNPETTVAYPLIEDGGTQWSPESITVVGTVTDNGITIDPTSV